MIALKVLTLLQILDEKPTTLKDFFASAKAFEGSK